MRVTLSKRDGRCLFDQLVLPASIRAFFGRPPVLVGDLTKTGLVTLYDVRHSGPGLGRVTPGSLLFPVSRVWPMGFSWSSFVAQSTMTAVCRTAGLPADAQMSDCSRAPISQTRWGLATDDVCVFSREEDSHVRQKLSRLDRAFVQHRIVRNEAKDLTHELNGTAVGIDLVDGLHLYASQPKLVKLLPALVWLLGLAATTPRSIERVLGHIDWFNLLNRPLFAVLDKSYDFARMEPANGPRPLPDGVKREMAVVIALALEWSFDLDTPWASELVATDASTTFGFGVARRRCTTTEARAIGRLSEKRGDFIALLPDRHDDAGQRKRLGTPHLLQVRQSAFRTVLSIPARAPAHATLLEAHGVRLALEWIARSPAKHQKRIVLLVDSKAVLGAVCKGRSGSGLLQGIVRRAGALALAAGLRLHCVYIPSEHNPADHPSRGMPIPEARRKPSTRAAGKALQQRHGRHHGR